MDQGPLESHTATLHPCHGHSPQHGRYTREGLLYLGALGSIGPETRCVVDDQVNNLPQLLHCEKISNQKIKTWHFSQNNSFINQATGRCLEVVPWQGDLGFQLVLQSCTSQRWTMQNSMTLQ
ncbi:hypothetical protein GJAV_G00169490 [Gymnothorax javanicus]|nr:hypothetical protein GJAV_G00169490 [Gymnothorax javanicus]